jgi:uncharacterized protein (DUF3084 family)
MTLTDAQMWTVIAGFLTAIFAMLGIITNLTGRTMRAEFTSVRTQIDSLGTELRTEIGSLGTELRTEIGSVRTEIGSVRTEIGSVRTEMRAEVGSLRTEMRSEFRRLDERFDRLEREVGALTKHVFGRPE